MAVHNIPTEIWAFTSPPTASICVEGKPFNLAHTDEDKVAGVAWIPATGYILPPPFLYDPKSGKSRWLCIVRRPVGHMKKVKAR